MGICGLMEIKAREKKRTLISSINKRAAFEQLSGLNPEIVTPEGRHGSDRTAKTTQMKEPASKEARTIP